MSIEARNRSLPDWFTRIRTHQTVLPRFQRFEAWDYSRVTQLFNTILQDLPVGSALVLEIGDEEPFISRTLKGAPEMGERVTEHLLDGQQRLTALWRGLHNNYDDRTFFVYLATDEESGGTYYVDSISRWRDRRDNTLRPLWADQPKEQWGKRMVPLHFFAPEVITQQSFRDWVRTAIEDPDERDDISDMVSSLRQNFASFNLPFMSLPVTTQKQTALDVFIRMNTSASPLSIYDIVVAQVEAGMGTSLHDLVADTRSTSPVISAYYSPENLALYSGALLQGHAPTNTTYMGKDFGRELLANWDVYLRGVSLAVDFLEQERVFDAARLPTDVVLPVLVALWGLAPEGLDAEGQVRSVLRSYMWRAFFTNRYERATNTRAFMDFNELKPLVSGKSASMPAIFNNSLYPLPQPQELVDAGWPVRKDRLARAILALSIKIGGVDLADGSSATRANLGSREYHHLFPKAYLEDSKVPNEQIFRSLNCALVTWRTNRNISDKKPERYLAERLDGTGLTEAEMRSRLLTHLIPYDEMISGDYEDFLEARANMVSDEMTKVCAVIGM